MYICATNDLANLSVENAFWRLARCTIVIQLNLAAKPKKCVLAFSKINDCPTIESCPIAPKSLGNPKRPLQPPGAKASLPRLAVVVFVVQKHKLAAYRTIAFS